MLQTNQTQKSFITQMSREEKIIFINVVKAILWILGIAAGLIVLIILISVIRNYHFEVPTSNTRRGWLKIRRQKRNRYQQSMRLQKRRRKSKRPNRFRDYDY